MEKIVYSGNIFHSLSFDLSESIVNGFIAVQKGKVVGIGDSFEAWEHPEKIHFKRIRLTESQFLMPGFIDTHIHAPQVPNLSLGLDKPLIEWLHSYTFPIETEYKDDTFASHVYEKVVKRCLDVGTTTACYFGTIHTSGCKILADQVLKQGQRAFIGKVAMDQNSPGTYIELKDDSIKDNIKFIEHVLDMKSDLIKPIITPRFAISCSMDLMKDLAGLAKRFDLPIQSHISENIDEIKFTLEIFPQCKTYAEVYDAAGILTNKTIMAHCVHLKDEELKLFALRGTSVSHCPASNTNLQSGLCDVKRIIMNDVRVGLGTDVSGGNRMSILDAIRSALDVSHHLNFIKKQNVIGTGEVANKSEDNSKYEPLNYKQAIFLGTLGGAQALNLDEKVGNFLIEKDFDALLIDIYSGCQDEFDLPKKLTEKLSADEKFQQMIQRFIYNGDDRSILHVFVQGRQVK